MLKRKKMPRSQLKALLNLSVYHVLALLASAACFMAFVDAAIQQIQMYFLNGQILFGNSMIKAALFAAVLIGGILHPRVRTEAIPLMTWLCCLGFLFFELFYLNLFRGMSFGDVLISYYDYYFLILIGPMLLVFRGAVPEKILTRCTIYIFIICAALAAAQYLTSSPILYTKSFDGSFQVASWEFIGEVRAFSFFGSALEFGLFCAFCGGLGIALIRTTPIKGTLLLIASALACYTTLTRLCYLIFFCAGTYSSVLTFGKKLHRGRWYPLVYFALGVSTILVGLNTFTSGEANKLQDAGSIFDRLTQWAYYLTLLESSTSVHQMFGLGIVQNESILPLYPMIIDNTALAIILHVGLVGLTFFGILLARMWTYLRQESLAERQPFIIAVTSLWATLACAGTFNIVLASFGTVFSLAILCERKSELRPQLTNPVKLSFL